MDTDKARLTMRAWPVARSIFDAPYVREANEGTTSWIRPGKLRAAANSPPMTYVVKPARLHFARTARALTAYGSVCERGDLSEFLAACKVGGGGPTQKKSIPTLKFPKST